MEMLGSQLDEYYSSAQFFEWQGQKIATWVHQDEKPSNLDKPSLLLLHGFPSASYDWHKLIPLLTPHFTCYALDFLGFGISSKPNPHRYSLLEQTDIVDAFIERQQLTELFLLCHDYGVSVGQELLARDHQQRIQSCLFLNGGLFAELHQPLLMQKLLRSAVGPMLVKLMNKGNLKRSFTRIFGPDTLPTDQDIDALWSLLNYAQGRRCLPALLGYMQERFVHAEKWLNCMQQRQQVLGFINGIHDPISGQHMLDRFELVCPDAFSQALPLGHYPQLEDAHAVYLALCQSWKLN